MARLHKSSESSRGAGSILGQLDRLSAQINGSGPVVRTFSPQDRRPLAEHKNFTSDDVEEACARARYAQPDWAAMPVRERARIFVRFYDLALGDRGLIDLVQAENGKSRYSAFEESLDIAGLSLYYGRKAAKILAPKKRAGALPLATQTWEHKVPKGVVGIISPWNYPLSLGVCDVIPALVAGNAVVHKVDSQTPLVVVRARELLIEAGLRPELWQIVVGEPQDISQALLDNIDHVCFTGSTQAGRHIAAEAGKRLIGCTLELGGKNPMIVLNDANLKKAASGAARACFSTAGQLCLSMERIYVERSVYDDFSRELVDATRSLRLGKGLTWGYDVGTLTSQRMLDRVQEHVDDAVEKGATVLTGGKARPDIGPYYFEPTVLAGVTSEMRVFAEETFGPVVSLYAVDTEAEAITQANATDYGLNASVWTRDVSRGRRVGERIMAGTVNINEGYGSAYASNDAPMGGMKASGQGRRHGEHGLIEYTELQNVASQHLVGLDVPKAIGPKLYATVLTAAYRLLKATRIK